MRKSDACCPYDYRPLHNKTKNQKDSKATKSNPSTNSNSRSEKEGQLGQALGRSSKNDSCLNKGGQQSQSFNNTPATGVNTTAVQKDKK